MCLKRDTTPASGRASRAPSLKATLHASRAACRGAGRSVHSLGKGPTPSAGTEGGTLCAGRVHRPTKRGGGLENSKRGREVLRMFGVISPFSPFDDPTTPSRCAAQNQDMKPNFDVFARTRCNGVP
jgi:hypothetical protein